MTVNNLVMFAEVHSADPGALLKHLVLNKEDAEWLSSGTAVRESSRGCIALSLIVLEPNTPLVCPAKGVSKKRVIACH